MLLLLRQVNDYLLTTKLRQEWGSDAFIQSDCCDS